MAVNVVSVLPDVNSTGVILQGAVIITFDKEIDVTTLSEQTFLLSAPAIPPVSANPDNLVGSLPPVAGVEYVQGTFSFAVNASGGTIATFRPATPLRQNTKYTVMMLSAVQTAAGETLANNYSWTFTTGVLNLKVPPAQNPLPSQVGRICKEDLQILPGSAINNDLHTIVIKFPGPIDTTTFTNDDIDIDLEAFLQDLDVAVPVVSNKTVTVVGNTMTITLQF